MGYQIKISYTSGNSFNTYNDESILELSWNNLEVAKANLRRISEHYKCYRIDNSYGGIKGWEYENLTPEQKLIYQNREKQDWYVNTGEYSYSIRLKTDEGKDFQISPFWVGYFETLNEIEIIAASSDMKITF